MRQLEPYLRALDSVDATSRRANSRVPARYRQPQHDSALGPFYVAGSRNPTVTIHCYVVAVGTWEQQQACTPDVWRLCGAQIPDVIRIGLLTAKYSATQRSVPHGF